MRLENSLAPNLLKRRKIVINFFSVVSPLRFCNCVPKFVSLCLKFKAGKMKNPNSFPYLQKKIKNKEMKKMPKKRTKR